MDVTDADLLALAGEDSSDEETTPAPAAIAKAVSPVPPVKSLNHNKDASANTNTSSRNASGKLAGGKRVKKTQKNEPEEEGEAYVANEGLKCLQ